MTKQAINTRTQEEYDALMEWAQQQRTERIPSSREWLQYRENTCINIDSVPILFGEKQWYELQGYTIIPYTEFAKANIVEEKRKLTREAAHAFLNEKFVCINEETLQSAVDKLKEIGFRQDGYPTLKDKVLLIDITGYSCSFSAHQIVIGDYTELQLSDLLSIDIIENQDYKALYLEGREVIKQLSFAGQITGGVAGKDENLQKAIERAEAFLTKHNGLTTPQGSKQK